MVACSHCGSVDDLHLITIINGESGGPGRMLVYCLPCRQNHEEKIDVDIPLGMVNRSLFLDLYRTGKTRSDPFTATELVFGRADPELVSQAQQLLATSRL